MTARNELFVALGVALQGVEARYDCPTAAETREGGWACSPLSLRSSATSTSGAAWDKLGDIFRWVFRSRYGFRMCNTFLGRNGFRVCNTFRLRNRLCVWYLIYIPQCCAVLLTLRSLNVVEWLIFAVIIIRAKVGHLICNPRARRSLHTPHNADVR